MRNDGEWIGCICERKDWHALCLWHEGQGADAKDVWPAENPFWESDAAKIGQVCVDCSGLISWGTGILRNSQGYHDTADAVFPIATIGQAPIGAAVWRKGHIGIYIGGGKYIAADGSAYGVRIGTVAGSGFTHWFRLKDIAYERKEDEMVTKETIFYNDKAYTVSLIRKDGVTYLKTRDIAEILGLAVGSRGKAPVLADKSTA